MSRCLVMIVAGLAWWATPTRAQDWVPLAFPERSFDLGTVARGSILRHRFPLVNRSGQEIRIASTVKKCGCTDVRLGAKTIPPGTQTFIEVTLDTTKFEGYKASGVTLVFDRPVPSQVDLNLTAFIRGDVQVTPGTVDFGVVARTARPSVTLQVAYSGPLPDWRVLRMETIHAAVSAELTERSRSPSQVIYQLQVTLDPSALTPGSFRDEILLRTTDPASPSLPISVSAQVQSQVTVSPSTLVLGRLKPGQVVQTTVLVRASKPCKIVDLQTTKGAVTASGKRDASQVVHPLKVSIQAPDRPGPYAAVLEVVTDLPDEPPARLSAFATISP
jgi:hypothetical protein